MISAPSLGEGWLKLAVQSVHGQSETYPHGGEIHDLKVVRQHHEVTLDSLDCLREFQGGVQSK